MKNIWLRIYLTIALFAFLPLTWAAPVTLVSDPGTYVTPTASELSIGTSFISSLFGAAPGNIFNGLRNAPTTLINPGLDASAPPLVLDNQHWEVATVPFPLISDNCPANTPVTITLSQWTVEQMAQTLPGSEGLRLGMAVMDSRDPTNSAAVSMVLTSSPDDIEDPGPHVAPSTSAEFTFADLPFFAALTGFEVARVVEEATVLQVTQASYSVSAPLSITLEYDDSACGVGGATAVPALSLLQMNLLFALLAGVGFVFLRRFEAVRG